MSTPAEQVEDEATSALSSWVPPTGDDLDTFLKSWPDTVRSIGQALTTMSEGWDGEHIHPGVMEAVKEHAQVLSGAADSAEDAFQEHRNKHALWLD